ncbi:ATP-grasp domain-containing protein [Streptomyces sp. NBC_01498]|uniref:ATP-grasp domain-containing protein n=1 Tax=Streptomyces sp. NBC_01498 TaxID=2975870 RepID=UPI002E7BE0AF|nr:ATP-grasp domain-containing protein [Streptomyces sp. NBC_01498]WTL25717.1 ATP-grasp domain-containing protein [Streptomyces sp. NBC_01498]
MTIAALEALSFGLARTAEAARAAGHRLVLLTGDRSVYRHELATAGSADASPDGPAGGLEVVDVDTFDPAAVRGALARLPDLAGLINSTDTWSLPAAELAQELGLPGPDPEAVRLLRDKARVRDTLHRAGLSAGTSVVVEPRSDSAQLIREAVGLPAVLKVSAGTSSRDVWIVPDEPALDLALAEAAERAQAPGGLNGRLFAEPFLAGPLYSAETLSWEGRTRLLGVLSRQTSRRPAVREEAAAFPVALPDGRLAAIERWVGDVLAAAGHDQGFAHVEFVLTRRGPELVEINRRIGGALVAEAMCRTLDVNVYEALVDVTLGRRPALLDAPLRPVGPAVAFVLVYADEPGVLERWDGLDGLDAFPGEVSWYPVRAPGDAVPHVHDQRGCTGMVLAEAETAELAQHRAWSAATTVRPVMKTADGADGRG